MAEAEMNDVDKIIKSLPAQDGDCEVIRFVRWVIDSEPATVNVVVSPQTR